MHWIRHRQRQRRWRWHWSWQTAASFPLGPRKAVRMGECDHWVATPLRLLPLPPLLRLQERPSRPTDKAVRVRSSSLVYSAREHARRKNAPGFQRTMFSNRMIDRVRDRSSRVEYSSGEQVKSNRLGVAETSSRRTCLLSSLPDNPSHSSASRYNTICSNKGACTMRRTIGSRMKIAA